MRTVTLQCRRCAARPITFGIYFEPLPHSEIADLQHHMDMNLKATCGGCGKVDWEVVSTAHQDIGVSHAI